MGNRQLFALRAPVSIRMLARKQATASPRPGSAACRAGAHSVAAPFAIFRPATRLGAFPNPKGRLRASKRDEHEFQGDEHESQGDESVPDGRMS